MASASAVSTKLVRPEEAQPKISVSAPRGKPPVIASSEAMPQGTVAVADRASNRDPGTTPRGSSSRRLRLGSWKGTARGRGVSGDDNGTRMTAEDIRDLGNDGWVGRSSYFRFLFAY
ncbi:MAG TPA: hypothetical protein VGR48_01285 [Terriglobales bacterium]|nr:hypothetical protein [Terriglobales bacterium]